MINVDVQKVTASVERRAGFITAVHTDFHVGNGVGQVEFNHIGAAVKRNDACYLFAVVVSGNGNRTHKSDTGTSGYRIFGVVVCKIEFKHFNPISIQHAIARSSVFGNGRARVIGILYTLAVGFGVPACKRL